MEYPPCLHLLGSGPQYPTWLALIGLLWSSNSLPCPIGLSPTLWSPLPWQSSPPLCLGWQVVRQLPRSSGSKPSSTMALYPGLNGPMNAVQACLLIEYSSTSASWHNAQSFGDITGMTNPIECAIPEGSSGEASWQSKHPTSTVLCLLCSH